MIDPANKDDLLLLSTRLLINMEEFEGVKTGDIAELKRIIGQENVTIRKVYDTQAQLYPRRASFIGSTNNMQFLKDYGGNRRFLVIPVKTIDYRTPVDHKGVYAQAVQSRKYSFGGAGYGVLCEEAKAHLSYLTVWRVGYADGFGWKKDNGMNGGEKNLSNLCMDVCVRKGRRVRRHGAEHLRGL